MSVKKSIVYKIMDVELLNVYQENHVEKICEILINRNIPLFFDVTGMGGGKSYTTIRIFQRLRDFYSNVEWTLMVICPKPAKDIWFRLCKQYEIPSLIYNYAHISGRFTKKKIFSIRHDYLRCDIEDGKLNYSYTDTLRELNTGDKRLLLVFDEAQSLKNMKTHINKAITVFNSCILNSNNGYDRSRIAFLSATLLDKSEHYESFLRVSNICSKPINTREGSEQVYNFAYMLDPAISLSIKDRYPEPLKKKNRKSLSINLFIKVILKNICSGMPVSIASRKYKGFFDISNEEDIEGIENANNLINLAMNIDKDKLIKGGIGNVSLGLHKINIHIVFDMCRVARIYLDEEPNCKVILSFDYKDGVLQKTEELLLEYGVNLLYGDMNEESRLDSIHNFNAFNNEVRVLIMTSKTGGESISLHDIDPDVSRPRYMFIAPGYNCSLIHQTTGRPFREGQTSIGRAFIFHPRNVSIPLNIFNTLKAKTIVTGTTYTENQNIALPGQYPIYVENIGYFQPTVPIIYDIIDDERRLNVYRLDEEPEPYYETDYARKYSFIE